MEVLSRNTAVSRNWTELERHAISAEYPDLKGQAWNDFKESVNAGLLNHHAVTIHEGQVLDGWQLQRACVELNVKPKYVQFPEDGDAEAFVGAVNDQRRHETQEKATERIEERRKRVAEGRAEGKSLRTIAATENVSVSTVVNDLEASGVQGCTPDGKVTGKDGKAQSATKAEVLCGRCQRVGKQKDCEACKEAKKAAAKAKQPTHKRGLDIPDQLLDADPKEPKEETVDDVRQRTNTEKEVFARKIIALIDEIPKDPWIDNDMNVRASIAEKLKHAAGLVRSTKCPKLCPMCRGEGCRSCYSTGRVTQGKYQQLV